MTYLFIPIVISIMQHKSTSNIHSRTPKSIEIAHE